MTYTKEKVAEIYAKNIREELSERGWTVAELARRMGISETRAKSLLERGTLTHDLVSKLCNVFDVDPWVLFVGE
jgi:plasmid maintenance system antidote protein VapI